MVRKALAELDDWKLVDQDQDLRGNQVFDASGRPLGTVDEMIVDTDQQHVVAIVLDNGQTYSTESLRMQDGRAILMGGATGMRETTETERIPLREEELRADKHTVQSGEVRVHKDVREEQQSFTVPTSREEVTIERHPVDRPSDRPVGEEETYRIPIREEEVEVSKRPVVREELEIGKRTVQEDERVSGTVRREEVEVEGADHEHRYTSGRCTVCGTTQR